MSTALIIDNDLRTITIPTGFVLGVYNDKDTHKVSFQAPRYYSGFDLSTFEIFVNFENAVGEPNTYTVTDLISSGSFLTFTWLVSREAYKKTGSVKFSICFKKLNSDDNSLTNEFNTTTATVRVLEGYETTNASLSENATIIPGTTPNLVIEVDADILSETTSARIDIMQYQVTSGSGANTLLYQKDATIESDSISYKLTQDDTYLMSQGTLKIQAHGLMKDGTAWKTQVFTVKVGESLTNTVIS